MQNSTKTSTQCWCANRTLLSMFSLSPRLHNQLFPHWKYRCATEVMTEPSQHALSFARHVVSICPIVLMTLWSILYCLPFNRILSPECWPSGQSHTNSTQCWIIILWLLFGSRKKKVFFSLFPILFNSIDTLLRQKLGVITPDFLSSSSIINQGSSIVNTISWKDAFQTSPVYSSPIAVSWLRQSSCSCS